MHELGDSIDEVQIMPGLLKYIDYTIWSMSQDQYRGQYVSMDRICLIGKHVPENFNAHC